MSRVQPICRYCGGTGRVWMDRSWFKSDGSYPRPCWLCSGTGFTDHNDVADASFVSQQRQKRAELPQEGRRS